MEFKEVCRRLLGASRKVSGAWSLEEGLSALAQRALYSAQLQGNDCLKTGAAK